MEVEAVYTRVITLPSEADCQLYPGLGGRRPRGAQQIFNTARRTTLKPRNRSIRFLQVSIACVDTGYYCISLTFFLDSITQQEPLPFTSLNFVLRPYPSDDSLTSAAGIMFAEVATLSVPLISTANSSRPAETHPGVNNGDPGRPEKVSSLFSFGGACALHAICARPSYLILSEARCGQYRENEAARPCTARRLSIIRVEGGRISRVFVAACRYLRLQSNPKQSRPCNYLSPKYGTLSTALVIRELGVLHPFGAAARKKTCNPSDHEAKWRWICHTLRKDQHAIETSAELESTSKGKRGRPRITIKNNVVLLQCSSQKVTIVGLVTGVIYEYKRFHALTYYTMSVAGELTLLCRNVRYNCNTRWPLDTGQVWRLKSTRSLQSACRALTDKGLVGDVDTRCVLTGPELTPTLSREARKARLWTGAHIDLVVVPGPGRCGTGRSPSSKKGCLIVGNSV
ncbi:hypothetical protein J6590_018675 [Homalodisca vitripennis]|nr:hypothetical protein J6590_018675 [Homalodisca vitripennis]